MTVGHVVVWSGGADSTSLLTALAKTSSSEKPVRAFTVVEFGDVNVNQFAAQRKVQHKLLQLLRKRGHHINHDVVSIRRKTWHGTNPGQALWWLSFLAPFINSDDTVHFGYIRRDDFWHHREAFEQLFRGIVSFGELDNVALRFDLEWCSKRDVLDYLKKEKIPKTCWWSCESYKSGFRPCGVCYKCEEISNPDEPKAGSGFPFTSGAKCT